MGIARDIALYTTPDIQIGVFEARPGDRDFETAGQPKACSCVFPLSAVWIEHEGGRPFVADPNVVTLYHPGQIYRRSRLSQVGDRSHWFSVSPQLVREVLRDCGGESDRADDRLFDRAWGHSDGGSFSLQFQILRHLQQDDVDDFWVQENALAVLRGIVTHLPAPRRARMGETSGAKWQRDRLLVETTRAILSSGYERPWSLSELAGQAGASLYHLCHVFKSITGTTVHRYLNSLRLRAALPALASGHKDLTTLALDLGFSSHSHFSAQFKNTFGCTPSSFRGQEHCAIR
jgi:AraC-like DNA-binding protein